jgi:GTP cyclohydrolase II
VFFGGPIANGNGSTWLMPILFENEEHRTRAVYELSFINCSPSSPNVSNAEVVFLRISDIDIKFQNVLSPEVCIFSHLINNSDGSKQYILIREVDTSNVYYPEIFTSFIYSNFQESDKEIILSFLKAKFHVKGELKDLTPVTNAPFQTPSKAQEGPIGYKRVAVSIKGKTIHFNVVSYYLPEDPWKIYYVVSLGDKVLSDFKEGKKIFLRIDSGCNSGQIYNDSSCDCLDQLHQGLANIAMNHSEASLLIHIPAHDGRGFGTAPKAETEIYKQGGSGRVNCTKKLDTVEAAILLYQTPAFDLRTYDGCAKILKLHRIHQVNLLTDNKTKMDGLLKHGISVKRKKTGTQKYSCLEHIQAKKSCAYYFTHLTQEKDLKKSK